MNLETISTCPICSSTFFNTFITAKDYTTSDELFEIVQCNQCKFTLTNPRPSQNGIGKYYQSENYISHSGADKTLFDKIYLLARRVTLKQKLTLISHYKSKGELLDVGCGTGEFLNLCKQSGWGTTGIEPSDTARKKASRNHEILIYQKQDHITNQQFDIITLWHVLEHVHDLENELRKLTFLLKKDGTIFIAVPNYNSPDAKRYKEYWAGYDVPRHLWHFSKDTVTRLLQKFELRIIEIQPMKLDAYYVSLLSEQYKNPKQRKIINALKAIWIGLSSNLAAKKNNNYSSMIYIVKRK